MLFNDPEAIDSGQSNVTPEDRPSLVGKRLVIVEDDGLTQALLRRACEATRMLVVGTANTGQEGVDLVAEQRPDILLADLHMSGMDGLETARQVLARMRVCVILITGSDFSENREEIIRLGVHGYLTKPVTKDVLIPSIQDAYARFRAGKTFVFSNPPGDDRQE